MSHLPVDTHRRLEAQPVAPAEQPAPIDMVLFCPACGTQHIDAPESPRDAAAWYRKDYWTNPPHRSHLCHTCGHVWRPADVPTNGVRSTQTRGKDDTLTWMFPAAVVATPCLKALP